MEQLIINAKSKGDIFALTQRIDRTTLSFFEEKKKENEREDQFAYAGFSDLDMIYYFVHRKQHIRESHDRKIETKKEYIRDLLQFYEVCLEHAGFLAEDVKQIDQTSLIRTLKPRHIESYVEWLAAVPLGKGGKAYQLATIERKVVVLKSFFRWLYAVEYIHTPLHTTFIRTTTRIEDQPRRELSYEEVKELLAFYENHPINYAILLLLATTGLRIREIATARWKDLMYDKYEDLYFLQVKAKRGKLREAVIFPYVFAAIQTFRSRRSLPIHLDKQDESPLFTTNKGNAYSYKYLSKYVTRIITKTKLSFLEDKETTISPHVFRHFFAEYSLQQGANIVQIQETLGHADLQTTRRYLDKTLKRKNNASLKWNKDGF